MMHGWMPFGFGPGWILVPGMLFLVIGGVVWVVALLLRGGPLRDMQSGPDRADDALRILDLRLSRGEIDVDDYERLRRELGHHHEIG